MVLGAVQKLDKGMYLGVPQDFSEYSPHPMYVNPTRFTGATVQALRRWTRFFVGQTRFGVERGLFRQTSRPDGFLGAPQLVVPNVMDMQIAPVIRSNGGSCTVPFCACNTDPTGAELGCPVQASECRVEAPVSNPSGGCAARPAMFPYTQPESADADRIVAAHISLTIRKGKGDIPKLNVFDNCIANPSICKLLSQTNAAGTPMTDLVSNVQFEVEFKNLNSREVNP
jgi:hypothetical protein